MNDVKDNVQLHTGRPCDAKDGQGHRIHAGDMWTLENRFDMCVAVYPQIVPCSRLVERINMESYDLSQMLALVYFNTDVL